MVERDALYFEPRCVGETGYISWYGEKYTDPELLKHTYETVYIRDNSQHIFVYSMESDNLSLDTSIEISTKFKLVAKIKKYTDYSLYGKCLKK